jgi:hypothetical protein
MSQWYFAKDGRQNGPVGIEELRSMAGGGTLARTDLVWNPSMKDWLPAGQVEGVFDAAVVPGGVPATSANPYATPGSAWVQATAPADLPEIEPGSDPIGIGDCIRRGFDLTTKNFLVLFLGFLIFIAVLFAVSIPFSAAQGISQLNQAQPTVVPGNPSEIFGNAFQKELRSQYSALGIISQLVSMVVSSFVIAGYYRITLNLASGLQASPGMLFGEGGKLVRILGVTFLIAIPNWIGNAALAFTDLAVGGTIAAVMFVITVVLWVRFGYAGMAIVDKNLGAGEALKYSLSITRNNGLRIAALGILVGLIACLGILACFVGMFFTVPLSLMIATVSYRWLKHGRAAALPVTPQVQIPQA